MGNRKIKQIKYWKKQNMNNGFVMGECGSYNPQTGESKKGYEENGQMKFRQYTFLEKIRNWFTKIHMNSELRKCEDICENKKCQPTYLGLAKVKYVRSNMFGNSMESECFGSVYKEKVKYQEKYIYYVKCCYGTEEIDGNAWDTEGKCVFLG
jgi:hypothetical protein